MNDFFDENSPYVSTEETTLAKVRTLYAVWEIHNQAGIVHIYKDGPLPGDPDKEYEFNINLSANYRYNNSNTNHNSKQNLIRNTNKRKTFSNSNNNSIRTATTPNHSFLTKSKLSTNSKNNSYYKKFITYIYVIHS